MTDPKPVPWLERVDIDDVTVLRVKTSMLRDDETTNGVFDHACSLVDDQGRSRLVLNLDGVGFMASPAIGKLILLMRKAASAGGQLVLCKPSRPVEEVFRVSRLNDILPSYDDEQEALRAFTAGGK